MSDVPMEEKKWQAESDARTLMEAQEIKSDKKRLKAAVTMLKEQSKQREKVMDELK